jgi:hypothetical protein
LPIADCEVSFTGFSAPKGQSAIGNPQILFRTPVAMMYLGMPNERSVHVATLLALARIGPRHAGRKVEATSPGCPGWSPGHLAQALQMTVIPLVVAQILAALAGPRSGAAIGGIGLRALVLFAVLLFLSGFAAAVLTRAAVGFYTVSPELAASIRQSVVVSPAAQQAAAGGAGPQDWVTALVPSNLVAAARPARSCRSSSRRCCSAWR